MSSEETGDVEIALPEVDPEAIYEEVDIAHQPIVAGPISNDLWLGLRGLGNGAMWAKRNLTRSLILFVSILIGADLVGRIAEPRLVNRIYDETTTAGYPISLNQDGYRGPRIEPAKAPGQYRVLALGDSVSFGTGVPFESTWPMVLAEQLTVKNSLSVDTINLSGPSADVWQLAELLSRFGKRHEPDAAVLMLTGNMVSLAWIRDGMTPLPLLEPRGPAPDRISSFVRRFPHFFAVPGILTFGMDYFRLAIGMSDHLVDPDAPYGVMLAHGIQQNTLPEETAQAAWSIVRQQLESIQRVALDLDIPLVVTYAPPRFALSDRWTDNLKSVPTERFTIDPIERAAWICAELRIPFVKIDRSLRAALAAGEEVFVLGDYTHFDRAGHHIVAEVLASEISRTFSAPGAAPAK